MKRTKICQKCRLEKNKTEFKKSSWSRDGFVRICNYCKLLRKRKNEKKYRNKKRNRDRRRKRSRDWYKKNKDKVLKNNKQYIKKNHGIRIITSIKTRCNNPNSSSYKRYGGKGIKCLITKEEINKLWYEYKAYLMDKPHIHRLNSKDHYRLDNCIFVPGAVHKEFEKLSIKEQKIKIKNIIKNLECKNETR